EQLARQVTARRRKGRETVDEIEAVLHAVGRRPRRNGGAAIRVNRKAECLGTGIVLLRKIGELEMARAAGGTRDRLQVPAGEYTSARIHVRLCVIADADRQQLQDFASEVIMQPR